MRRALPALTGEPYLLYLIFAGLALGTVLLPQNVRLALLWTALILLSVAYRGTGNLPLRYSPANVGRGALLGLVIAVPLTAVLLQPLRTFNERLYQTQDVIALYYQVCLVAAPAEELFFRGVIQSSKGSSVGIGLYALTGLLFFAPHAPLPVATIVVLAMGLLGIAYAYVADRHGIAAALACHMTVGLVLQVVPSLAVTLRLLLS